jgi:hypothetical protein
LKTGRKEPQEASRFSLDRSRDWEEDFRDGEASLPLRTHSSRLRVRDWAAVIPISSRARKRETRVLMAPSSFSSNLSEYGQGRARFRGGNTRKGSRLAPES